MRDELDDGGRQVNSAPGVTVFTRGGFLRCLWEQQSGFRPRVHLVQILLPRVVTGSCPEKTENKVN